MRCVYGDSRRGALCMISSAEPQEMGSNGHPSTCQEGSLERSPHHEGHACGKGGRVAERHRGVAKHSWGERDTSKSIRTNGKRAAREQFGSHAEICAEHHV